MKRILLIFLLPLLALAGCTVVDGDSHMTSDRYFRSESSMLVLRHVSMPTAVLTDLLSCDAYLSASEEERASDAFAAIAARITLGDDGTSFTLRPWGTVSTGGTSLREAGASWLLASTSEILGYFLEFNDVTPVSFHFTCLDPDHWSFLYEGDFPGHSSADLRRAEDGVVAVDVSGTWKTLDGYDCTFSTPAPVNATVTTKNGVTYLHLEGTFVHPVGRDGVLKNRCEAVYDASGDVRYMITR